jgi:5,5'-dehydrodivanillate O-demethylase oxygenase subunit
LLDHKTNKILSEVGADAPMGQLMRRYWQPIGAVSELARSPIKSVRLMGEDLVLYRDLSGNYGLVDRHCPHRRADMKYGFTEECGLRCSYHGWLFDHTGACLSQPFEETADPDARFREKIRIKAYPVEARAGLLWAYLGPDPAPLVPNYEPFEWENGFVQIVFSVIPCNWFQCQENSIDPVHFEWMHANWTVRQGGGTGPYAPGHLKVKFEEFEHGMIYKRVREDTDENDPLWTVGRNCLWPNSLFTGDHFEWRVPIDDHNTLSVGWFYNPVPQDMQPFAQDEIPSWHGPVVDDRTGEWITSHVMNQDFAAWVGQGEISDRSREHLGRSDQGVIMMRQRFLDDLDRIEKGEDPKAIYRDPVAHKRIELPILERAYLDRGPTRAEADDPNFRNSRFFVKFIFQAGQPDEVWAAYCDAMGIEFRADRQK